MMKRYRVLKPHDWVEKPNGPTIHGNPGEMAVLPDAVFAAAPVGTFELLPGEEGYVAPSLWREALAPTLAGEGALAQINAGAAKIDVADAPSPPKQRKPKAEAFKSKPKKR